MTRCTTGTVLLLSLPLPPGGRAQRLLTRGHDALPGLGVAAEDEEWKPVHGTIRACSDEPELRREQRALYAVAVAVLIVGLAFAGVPLGTPAVLPVLLACP